MGSLVRGMNCSTSFAYVWHAACLIRAGGRGLAQERSWPRKACAQPCVPHAAWFSAHRRQDGSRGVRSGKHRPSNVVPPSFACNLVFLQHMCLKRGQRF